MGSVTWLRMDNSQTSEDRNFANNPGKRNKLAKFSCRSCQSRAPNFLMASAMCARLGGTTNIELCLFGDCVAGVPLRVKAFSVIGRITIILLIFFIGGLTFIDGGLTFGRFNYIKVLILSP